MANRARLKLDVAFRGLDIGYEIASIVAILALSAVVQQAERVLGHRAVNAVAAFPMEQDKFPGKNWALSHKPIAVAARLGACQDFFAT